jgi:cytochrome oxidase Cu insertion factor (SCO1/SenC/PrrC family)
MKGAGMPRWTTLMAAAAFACLTGTMASAQDQPAQPAQPAGLNVGDKAPDFSLPGTDGKTHTLADLKGKTVILAWFPKAFTGG